MLLMSNEKKRKMWHEEKGNRYEHMEFSDIPVVFERQLDLGI